MKKLILLLLAACEIQVPKQKVDEPKETPKVVEQTTYSDIDKVISTNGCKDFYFNDYGNTKSKAPLGYVKGLAYTYAQKKCKKETTPESPSQFAEILGLGLWECSGRCCGVDLSSGRPNKITENSAEAGQWQSSFDIKYNVPAIVDFTKNWKGECFLSTFGPCTGKEATTYGKVDSDGWKFQQKLKACPAFGADVVLLNWNFRKSHYWPFKKGIVQKVPACVDLFKTIENLVQCK